MAGQELSIDSLQLNGFQRAKSEAEGFGHQYYGPDMTVMVSDWFLDTHCFSLDKDRSKGDTVVIKFDPVGHPKYVDVSGTLVLDRSTLTMRTLTYELRDLPDGVPIARPVVRCISPKSRMACGCRPTGRSGRR